MKKEYIKPEMLLEKIKLERMIAAVSDPTAPKMIDDPADEEGEVLTRRRHRSVWDDDEEEQGW